MFLLRFPLWNLLSFVSTGAGVFGVEMFLLADGSLLLNEIAPRPHNSGHYTIEACATSQYEQHLRAILGWPLGDTSLVVGSRWAFALPCCALYGTSHNVTLSNARMPVQRMFMTSLIWPSLRMSVALASAVNSSE